MVSCAEKDRKIIPLTWRNCWKVVHKIWGFWPENEGKNEATVLDFFLQIGFTESMVSGAEKDREIIPLTWTNCWKVAPEIRGFGRRMRGKMRPVLDFFLQIGLKESMLSGAEKQREIILLTFKNSRKVALDIKTRFILSSFFRLDWIVTL